jgi:hypothetical protein
VLWAPDFHLQELEKIWLDGLMNVVPWKHHVLKLQKEWKELILYATVLCEFVPTICLLFIHEVWFFVSIFEHGPSRCS